MTDHKFLTPDRKVRLSVFGEGIDSTRVIVNGGDASYACRLREGIEVVLPPWGFLIDSPTFMAFCAIRFAGFDYDSPRLFTLRSLDGKPLADSGKVRVFHGFGNGAMREGKVIEKEAILPGR